MNLLQAAAPAVTALLLSACAVGPDYARPTTIAGAPLATSFVNAPVAQAAEPRVADFWTAFQDPLLSRLVTDYLAANRDLRAAAANLRAARVQGRLSGFDLYPTVTASGSYQHTRLSETQLPGVSSSGREFDAVEAGFDAVWEFDLFGRVRRGVEAAKADAEASLASLQDAQVSVSAEVARNYFILRGVQDQLAVAQRNADNQKRSLDITRTRLDAGRGNELDTNRADAQLQTTLANIPALEATLARTIYRLGVLTGRAPTALNADLQISQRLPELPPLDAVGTPDRLLRRRPDIRVAERGLAAATARIGVAVGDLFPKVSLIGSIGFNAGSLNSFGGSGSSSFFGGPSITWAAFDLFRVQTRIEISEARTEAALARYEQTVLGALEETEGALITYDRALIRRDTLARAAASSARAASLGRQRFEGGLTNFLDVLDAERSALQAEDLLARGRTDAATALIAVYKALGGGWTEAPSLAFAGSASKPTRGN